MKNILKSSLFGLFVLTIPFLASADDDERNPASVRETSAKSGSPVRWEIWTGSMISADITNSGIPGQSNHGMLSLFSPDANSGSNPSFGYFITNNIQLKITPTFSYVVSPISGGNNTAIFELLGGVNFSFSGDSIQNSFFVEAQAGAYMVNAGGATSTNLTWLVSLGKRFPVLNHINYVPEISYSSMSQTSPLNPYAAISVVPLQFTLTM